MNATCPSPHEWSALMYGDACDITELETHLETCLDCQKTLETLSDDPDLMSWIGSTPYRPNPFPFLKRSAQTNELGTIGRYHIETEIGRGGMGIVFRGRDTELRRLVALKVLRSPSDDERMRERFAREARSASQVRHDHLVPILDIIQTDDHRPVIVMPLIVGQSLKTRIQTGGPLPEREAAKIARQISDALVALHAAGLIHRDVKPANILLDSTDQRAKLTDFGLSRDITAGQTLTQEGTIVGTPEYLSPEQATESTTIDQRADLYSLGVTLYESLTGVVPFRGSPYELINHHRLNEPIAPRRLVSTIPAALETICLTCLAKRPERRYQSAIALRDDLDRYQSNQPIHAKPIGIVERSVRWCQRNPWPVAVVVVSLVGFILAAGGWWQATIKSREAVKATQDAVENARLADDRAMLSLNAINTLITKAQNLAANTPGTLDLKKQLNEAALSDLRQLTAAIRNVPGADRSRIQAHTKLADTFRLLGQTDEAVANWQVAINLVDELLASQPGDEQIRRDLAIASNSLGNTLSRLGKSAEAATHGDRSIQILSELLTAHPDDAKLLANLAIAHTGRGDTDSATGKTGDAIRHYNEAVTRFKQAIQLDPNDPKLPAELFTSTGRIGYARLQLQDFSAAVAGFRDQYQVAQTQLERKPNDAVWKRNVLMITLDLSSALQRAGQGEESEKLARSTIEPLQRVAEVEPENALRQREHSVAYEHLANALMIQSRFSEAERAYVKSYEIAKAISSRSTASHFVNDMFSATFALANVAEQQGHYTDAAKWIKMHFEYAMQINGSSMNQLQKNNMKAAFDEVIAALTATPESIVNPSIINTMPPGQAKRLAVFRSMNLARSGKIDQAEADILQALEKSKDDALLMLCHAKILGLAADREKDPVKKSALIERGSARLKQAVTKDRSLQNTLYLSPELVPILLKR